MMIRISGNIWLIRIQPSPSRVIMPLRRAKHVRRRQPDHRRQQRRDDGDLEAVDPTADELMVLLAQRRPVVLEREVLRDEGGVELDELARPLERHRQHPEEREAEEDDVARRAPRTGSSSLRLGLVVTITSPPSAGPRGRRRAPGDHEHHRAPERRRRSRTGRTRTPGCRRTASAAGSSRPARPR